MRLTLIAVISIFLSVLYLDSEQFKVIGHLLSIDSTWFGFLFASPILMLSSLILDQYFTVLKARGIDYQEGIVFHLSGKFRVFGYLYSGCILANFGYKVFLLDGFSLIVCTILLCVMVLLGLIALHTYNCKQERGILCVYKHKNQHF